MRDRRWKLGNWVPVQRETGDGKRKNSKVRSCTILRGRRRPWLTVGHLPLPGAEVIRAIYTDNSSRLLANLIISSFCPRYLRTSPFHVVSPLFLLMKRPPPLCCLRLDYSCASSTRKYGISKKRCVFLVFVALLFVLIRKELKKRNENWKVI